MLSDPKVKALYDSGKDVSQDTDFMQSGAFFSMLFGSARFDEFIGELMVSTIARMGEADHDRAAVCSPSLPLVLFCDDCAHGRSRPRPRRRALPPLASCLV